MLNYNPYIDCKDRNYFPENYQLSIIRKKNYFKIPKLMLDSQTLRVLALSKINELLCSLCGAIVPSGFHKQNVNCTD